MNDWGIISEFTGSEYIFKIFQEVDKGGGGGYLKGLNTDEFNAYMLEEVLWTYMGPTQAKTG